MSAPAPKSAVIVTPMPPEFLMRTSLGGSSAGRKSFALSELFFTALDLTAFFFSWAAPTLFLGSAASAYEVPQTATSMAQMATTRAGEGRIAISPDARAIARAPDLNGALTGNDQATTRHSADTPVLIGPNGRRTASDLRKRAPCDLDQNDPPGSCA